jgi:uracil-DNA glycosylase family 4
MTRATAEFRYAALKEMGLAPLWRLRVARISGGEPEVPAELPQETVEMLQAAGASQVTQDSKALDATGHLDNVAKDVPAERILTAAQPLYQAEAPTARGDAIKILDWAGLEQQVQQCRACALGATRKRAVLGVGARQPEWLFVGEAPGAEEDERGEPFVGEAGRLLDNMLRAIGIARGREVYIANVIKCRPPHNRNPDPAEVMQCQPYLLRQIELLDPSIVVALGRFAAETLLGTHATVASLRGRVHQVDLGGARRPVVVTYHPAYLLRSLGEKQKAWADLCLARSALQGYAQATRR